MIKKITKTIEEEQCLCDDCGKIIYSTEWDKKRCFYCGKDLCEDCLKSWTDDYEKKLSSDNDLFDCAGSHYCCKACRDRLQSLNEAFEDFQNLRVEFFKEINDKFIKTERLDKEGV
jgi:hypothetical protein